MQVFENTGDLVFKARGEVLRLHGIGGHFKHRLRGLRIEPSGKPCELLETPESYGRYSMIRKD